MKCVISPYLSDPRVLQIRLALYVLRLNTNFAGLSFVPRAFSGGRVAE